MNTPYLTVKAFLVKQPLGDFFVCKIKAEDLLKTTFSSEFRIKEESENKIEFTGNQRSIKIPKSKSIAVYIDSVESAFPNSIILAANYNEDGEEIVDDLIKWEVERLEDDIYNIIIPTHQKVSSIIDGQHRLDGFRYIKNMDRLNTELVCSVYFGLPLSYQAYLFANINGTQTPVTKNLTYNLYGFNLEEEERYAWSPEKLAVYITRNFNFERDSIFYRKIKISPIIDAKTIIPSSDWSVSTATMVEGIVSLFSKKPKRDQDILASHNLKVRTRDLLSDIDDSSPLRSFYLSNNDVVIEKTVSNFFNAVDKTLFTNRNEESFIIRNVGFKALFEVLYKNLQSQIKSEELDVTENYFINLLMKVKSIDFSNKYFRISSYVGKSRIANTLLIGTSLMHEDELKSDADRSIIANILNRIHS